MFAARLNLRQALRSPQWAQIRFQSTLEGRPYIYVFPNEGSNGHVLSLLPSKPTRPELAIGLTSQLPPTPQSFKENPGFLNILHEVISKHAHEDPDNISQAQVMVSTSGANLSSGGVLLTGQKARRRRATADSSGGASGQGGVGSAGRGGWIHVFDERRPPEYGRIPWYGNDMIRNFGEWDDVLTIDRPEDIFGSLEVDGDGKFVGGNGNYQPSGMVMSNSSWIDTRLIETGTYRTITRDGIIGLSPFLREKMVQKLREYESK